ncbi:MAG: dTDP-4-dehydrorhamnose 3,5-epimerase [Pseudomonadota bacterium]
MKIDHTELGGVKLLQDGCGACGQPPRLHLSHAQHILGMRFRQECQQFTRRAGTVRGLFGQVPPHAGTTLLRVVAGQIKAVTVDLRVGSTTYGRWAAATLSAANRRQLLVPPGVLHGFITIVPDTTVLSRATVPAPSTALRRVHFADPALNIDWGIPTARILADTQDANAPRLHGQELAA